MRAGPPSFLRASPLLALGALGCRSATQIEIAVTTDLPCTRANGGASLTSGALVEIEGAPPATTSRTCTDSKLGTVVLIPSDATDAKVAFKVVGGIDGQNAEDCKAPEYGPKCIVARRALRFEPHTPLSVPVVLRASCAGVSCDATQTCVQGACVDATIDPAKCEGSGCGESELGGGAGPSDAGVDATTADATLDGAGEDAGDDGSTDGPAGDAPPTFDGAVVGCDMRGLQPGAPYPMFGYCPSHRNRSPLVGPASQPSAALFVVPFAQKVTAVPIVAADGTIYVASADTSVFAIEPDGGPRWTYSTGDGGAFVGGAPAIGRDGTLYVLTRYPNSQLVALDPASGGVKGSAPASDSISPVTIGPDGTVYYTGVASDVHSIVPDGGGGFSIFLSGSRGVDFSPPSVAADGTLYLGDDQGFMTALYRDGGVRWSTSLATNLDLAGEPIPIAPDGTLRAYSYGADSHVFARDPGDGGPLWSVQVGGGARGVAVGDHGETVAAAENELWFVGADGDGGPRGFDACSRPTIAADGIIYAGCAGELVALDPTATTRLWHLPFSGSINDSPVLGVDRTIYFTVQNYDATHSALYAIK